MILQPGFYYYRCRRSLCHSGVYEVLKPQQNEGYSMPTLGKSRTGMVSTVMSASSYDPITGVNITIRETYEGCDTQGTEGETNVHHPCDQLNSNSKLDALLTPDRNELYRSSEFRTAQGNQVVANAFTLRTVVPRCNTSQIPEIQSLSAGKEIRYWVHLSLVVYTIKVKHCC